MDFSKYNLTPIKVLKIALFGLIALAVVLFVGSFVMSIVNSGLSFRQNTLQNVPSSLISPGMMGESAMDGSYNMKGYGAPTIGTRNIATMPPSYGGGTTGSDAEAFEVGEHSASIETRNKSNDCKTIADLKSRDYVIFENARDNKRGCNFTFKVTRDHADEILGVIKGLNPKDISDTTYTIKQQVNDYTNQIQILENKRASIDETLSKAIVAYDEITRLAIQTRDAGSLATIIDSKVGIIERLTQQRIDINAALDNLARNKADQLDRLAYTHFNVTIYENKFIDGEQLKDSWKQSLRNFTATVNWSLQNATINLVKTIVVVIPFILYALLILIVAKYSYRIGKRIWEN